MLNSAYINVQYYTIHLSVFALQVLASQKGIREAETKKHQEELQKQEAKASEYKILIVMTNTSHLIVMIMTHTSSAE